MNASELTDVELVLEKKKLKKSKIMNAFIIGFLASIVVIGIVSSIIGKNFGALIPLLFPIYFIYRLVSNSNKNKELEMVLKERNI
ncbi:MAG: hypothetical protein ABJI22_13475 [Maribacter sp.]